MGDEIELKLAVTPSDLVKIRRAKSMLRNQLGDRKKADVVSVYYDTPDRVLKRNGISFRLRRQGGKYLQTVKAESGDLARRKEWEFEVSRNRPEFKATKGIKLEPLLKKKIRKQLKPVFETHVRREAIVTESASAKVEISLDRGVVKCDRARAPISEVELELKEGDPTDLFALARKIEKVAPVRLATLSKADAGYRLADHKEHRPFRSTQIVLARQASTAEVFREVSNSCLRQVVANEKSVGAGQPEGVHQMRIGLRRLRAAIAFFSKLTQGDLNVEKIKQDLKWITTQLAPARDLDVYLRNSVEPLEHAKYSTAGSHALKQTVKRRRKAAFSRARQAIRSKRYRKTILDVAEWLNAGPWLTTGDVKARAHQQCPAVNFVSDELTRRRKKLAKKGTNLESIDVQQRHKIRINAKKLRYASEFFASMFPGRKAKRQRRIFVKSLKRLQSSLGDLNDFALHAGLANRLTQSRKTHMPGRRARRRAFAAGAIAGKERVLAQPLFKSARSALQDFSEAKRYWWR